MQGAFRIQWIIFGLVVLGLSLFGAADLYQRRVRTAEHEQERLLAMTKVIAVDLEQNLRSVNDVLSNLQKAIPETPLDASFNMRLGILTDAMPGIRTININDASGTVRASNRRELIGIDKSSVGIPLTERDYFQHALQDPSLETLHVSQPFLTNTNLYTIVLSKRINGPHGEFAGVVVATLDPAHFYPLLNAVRYTEDVAVGLSHGDGVVFLLAPHERDAALGKNLRQPDSLFSLHKESRQTTTVLSGTMRITGEERMIAQHTVRPPELKMCKSLEIAVSRRTSAIYELWWSDVWVRVAYLLIVTTFAGLGLFVYQARVANFTRQEQQAVEAIRLSEARLNQAELVSKTGNWELHLDSNCIVASVGAAKLYGVCGDRFSIETAKDMVLPEYRPYLDASLKALLENDTPYDVEFKIRAADTGEVRDIRSLATFDRNKRILFGIIQDVTERKKTEQELERLAQTDPMTGLANRRHFTLLAEQELSRTLRYGGPLSVLMLDIDHFKRVNDSYGHATGDRAIQALAHVCQDILRDIDLMGRIGGEEFAVVLPQTASAQALDAAQRLRQAIAAIVVPMEYGQPLSFTVSIGVATLPDPQTSLETLLGYADNALYAAKRGGRNRVCVHGEDNPAG